jgi:hypothetical protein
MTAWVPGIAISPFVECDAVAERSVRRGAELGAWLAVGGGGKRESWRLRRNQWKPLVKGASPMRTALVTLVLVLCSALPVAGQTAEEAPAPPTKLEAFMAQGGAVIVRGFSRIGEIHGRDEAGAAVDAQEVTNAASGEKAYGITITVKGAGASATERTSYIDYDEIDALTRSLDALVKVDRSATQLAEFRADYRTRDGLEVSTFGGSQPLRAAISSGHRVRVTALVPWPELAKLKDIVVQAKTTLDSTRQ